jgi:hypothetical protein
MLVGGEVFLAEKRPRPVSRAGLLISVAAGFAVARPDEDEAVFVLSVEKVGIHRCVEAGIVELD